MVGFWVVNSELQEESQRMATEKAPAAPKKSTAAKKAAPKKRAARKKPAAKKSVAAKKAATKSGTAKFPRHSVGKAIRIPEAILNQNAGKACSRLDAAKFLGLTTPLGPFAVEISSAIKYGLLEKAEASHIEPTTRAKKILQPKSPNDKLDGYREAVMNAPDLSEVYQHYRGENLPDEQFFRNTVVETYKVPAESFKEFKQVFLESLETAELVTKQGGKTRVLDVATGDASGSSSSDLLKKLEKTTSVGANDSCFVMQPFAAPLGEYYDKIYRPAIEKAGLRAVRADAEIFGAGKIMDQVWQGINTAKVLVPS